MTAKSVSLEEVVMLARRLSPRDKRHLVERVLPDLEGMIMRKVAVSPRGKAERELRKAIVLRLRGQFRGCLSSSASFSLRKTEEKAMER